MSIQRLQQSWENICVEVLSKYLDNDDNRSCNRWERGQSKFQSQTWIKLGFLNNNFCFFLLEVYYFINQPSSFTPCWLLQYCAAQIYTRYKANQLDLLSLEPPTTTTATSPPPHLWTVGQFGRQFTSTAPPIMSCCCDCQLQHQLKEERSWGAQWWSIACESKPTMKKKSSV